MGKGELDQAVAAHTEALRLDPASERCAARARVFTFKRDSKRAIDDYTEAIRLDPRDPMLYLMRASIYRSRGDEALPAEDERKMEDLRK